MNISIFLAGFNVSALYPTGEKYVGIFFLFHAKLILTEDYF